MADLLVSSVGSTCNTDSDLFMPFADNFGGPLTPHLSPSSVSSYDKNQAYSTEWSDDEQPTAFSGNENGGNGNSFEDDSSTGKGVRVRALYDYDGQEQDELTFKAGNYQRPDDTGQGDFFLLSYNVYIKGPSHITQVFKERQPSPDFYTKAPLFYGG